MYKEDFEKYYGKKLIEIAFDEQDSRIWFYFEDKSFFVINSYSANTNSLGILSFYFSAWEKL